MYTRNVLSFIHAIRWINFNIFNGKFISFSIDQQFILFSILQIPTSINSTCSLSMMCFDKFIVRSNIFVNSSLKKKKKKLSRPNLTISPNLIHRIALSSISSTPFTRSFESSNSDENFEAASSRSWTGAWTRRTGHPSSSLDKISREWKWSVDETLGHQRPQFQGFYHPPAVSHPRQSLGESDERTRRRGRFTFSR